MTADGEQSEAGTWLTAAFDPEIAVFARFITVQS